MQVSRPSRLSRLLTTHNFQDIFHQDKCAYKYKLSSEIHYAKLTCDIHKTSDQTF